MKGETATLYWHTLRPLRLSQVLHLLRMRLWPTRVNRRNLPKPRASFSFSVAAAEHYKTMLSATHFKFVGKEGECRVPSDWNNPSHELLWRYNLHYFDDLQAEDRLARREWHYTLVERWIAENPPSTSPGWHPYPTSLRAVNWMKWSRAEARVPAGFVDSLALQCRWLSKRTERHLLANHLFANAKALCLAGMFFEGAEADAWLQQGLELLRVEIGSQILSDGGHFERSPMYHVQICEDLLDLINAAEGTPGRVARQTVGTWRKCAAQMLGWLENMTHPDGEIALFNDSAFDVVPTPSTIHSYAKRLGILATGGTAAAGSGYVRCERGPAVLIADVGCIGPDEQPGHAHADTLSFELSLYGHRLIVDTGTSTYSLSDERFYERSSAAHNTVQIDDEDSSEVWGVFRVARRAYPVGVWAKEADGCFTLEGSHDGYLRLRGRPVHKRRWQLERGRLIVIDEIAGAYSTAVGRFLLHPRIEPRNFGSLTLPSGRDVTWSVEGARARIEPALWAPRFGEHVKTSRIVCELSSRRCVFEISWK